MVSDFLHTGAPERFGPLRDESGGNRLVETLAPHTRGALVDALPQQVMAESVAVRRLFDDVRIDALVESVERVTFGEFQDLA